jgi:hypothetical protein
MLITHTSNRPKIDELHRPERIYADQWVRWNDESLVKLPLARPRMDQADATVAASIIQYLGTKGGILLLTRVWTDIDCGLSREGAWLKEYRRFTTEWLPQVNKGFTPYELCLAPAWTERQRDLAGCCKPRHPDLAKAATRRELQVARSVFRWLATIPGQIFIEEAEHLVEADKAHQAALHHIKWNLRQRAV